MLTTREIIKTLYNAFNQKLKNYRGNWEQNDPTADDYIKNRPFYTDDSKKVVIVPNQQITFSNYLARLMLSEIIEFVAGQSYEVKWDNVNYTCVAWDFNGIGAIGNQRLMDGPIDTGEPFIIMISKAEGVGVIQSLTTTGTHTVEVTASAKIVKIDKKYLPNFARVATSGSYNDLSNKPIIPDIDATLSIEGDAADAKATGDAINAPKEAIFFIDQVNGYKYVACMRDGNFVTYCAIKNIEVTSMPSKIEYIAGDYFDPTGMIVSAVAYDGTTKEIVDYSLPASYLMNGTTAIEISYIDAGVVYTVNVPITVNEFDPAIQLIDFTYIENDNGTYTITGWKETLNGESSTEMIIPNNGLIIV